jgi:hypothetical protein
MPPTQRPLRLGRRNLVPDALGGDLALELGEREQDVQRQPSHGRGRVELLGDRDERDIVLVEELDQLGEVRQRACQAIDLVNHDDIDLAGLHIIEKAL